MKKNLVNKLIELYNETDVSVMVVDAQNENLLYANQRVSFDMNLPKKQMLGCTANSHVYKCVLLNLCNL